MIISVRLLGGAQKAITSFIISVDLDADLVTFSQSMTKLSDKDGCAITSNALFLATGSLDTDEWTPTHYAQ